MTYMDKKITPCINLKDLEYRYVTSINSDKDYKNDCLIPINIASLACQCTVQAHQPPPTTTSSLSHAGSKPPIFRVCGGLIIVHQIRSRLRSARAFNSPGPNRAHRLRKPPKISTLDTNSNAHSEWRCSVDSIMQRGK